MVGFISQYIEHFTYLGLLVVLMLCGLGLPLPEDVALLAGGFLAHRGVTRYPMTLAVSLIGVVAGDNSLFFLGRRFGTGLVAYIGLGKEWRAKLERLKEFTNRHGHRAIFYARFLAGVRALVYLIAGSLGVKPGEFLFYDFAGAMISVPIVVSVGYWFGPELERIIFYIGGFDHVIMIVAALSLGIYLMRSMLWRKPTASGDAERETGTG